jgi:hypothetical protein
MIFLGYDPGGARRNGLAIVDFRSAKPTAQTATCSSVDEAVAWFRRHAEADPDAIGIDALLSWATGPSGWREMDKHLRDAYPAVQNSVLSSNSAYGSMAVQGMALAIRMQERWPEIHLNETHPKVLYHALTRQKYAPFRKTMVAWLKTQFSPSFDVEIKNDHEWDALISAWATWRGLTGQWKTDLMDGVDDLIRPAGLATYYWP